MRRRTIPRPRPRLPPVTITLRMASHLAGGGNLERGNEPDRRRDLVRGQGVVTELKDLALEVDNLAASGGIGLAFQDDVGGDQRSDDGTPGGPHHRHSYRRVAVDRRFDFLRVDLQHSNVDDAAPSTQEVVPVAAA